METRLTVLRRDEQNHRNSICLCQCGTEKSIRTHKVRHGIVKSCGCLSRELASKRLMGKLSPNALPVGVSGLNKLFADYKKSASKKDLPFELSKEVFSTLTASICNYCGAPPSSLSYQRGSIHLAYKYNGIDRIDSGKGYTVENSVPCCPNCNYGKRQLTPELYIEHCKKVVKYNEKEQK